MKAVWPRGRDRSSWEDMGVDPEMMVEYVRWVRWTMRYPRLTVSSTAGIMAAQHQERLIEEGLLVAGVG